MPRAFLVKRRNSLPVVRSWDELPDEERADTYIPYSIECILKYVHEDSNSSAGEPQEESPERSRSVDSICTQAEDLSTPTEEESKQEDQELPPQAVPGTKPTVRSKVKFTTGSCNEDYYSCEVCGKGFRLQRMLNRHLKCHNEVKRHLCTFCGKGFNDTFDLKRHVRTHTGIRPYKCEICHKAFTQRCSLESHLKKIHGVQQGYAYKQRRDKLFVCEDCGYTGPSQENLYRHVLKSHPGSAFLKKTTKKLAAILQNKIVDAFEMSPKQDEELE